MCAPSIRNMHWSEELHDRLMEERLRRAVERMRRIARLGELYQTLVALDPANGEEWYDSDAVSNNLETAIKQVSDRIDQLIGT